MNEEQENPCDASPCENGGACSVSVGEDGGVGFSCDCRLGYEGERCETGEINHQAKCSVYYKVKYSDKLVMSGKILLLRGKNWLLLHIFR